MNSDHATSAGNGTDVGASGGVDSVAEGVVLLTLGCCHRRFGNATQKSGNG